MSAGARRVVFVTPSLPLRTPLHAGGLLQRDVTESLHRQGAEVHVLTPAYRTSLESLPDVVPGVHVVMPELLPARWSPLGIMVRLAHRLNARAARSALQGVHPPFLLALLMQPRIRVLLRSADVIDLQWFGPIRLLAVIRVLAGRGPRIVGTFHDVVSQRLERAVRVETAPGPRERLVRAARRARRLERRLGRRLDRSVVLSGKDRKLLIEVGVPAGRIEVLAPRIEVPAAHGPGAIVRETAGPGSSDGDAPLTASGARVVFVGYLRRLENHDAALWLVREIWPRVLADVPAARLRIVGGGAKPELEAEVARRLPAVELAGFVDDLWAEYLAADCSVVPLRDGAGVKFKTIESLLAGVPTVATPIGAEGVGLVSDFVAVSEDAAELARGIVRAVTETVERRRAQAAAHRLEAQHGRVAFDRTIAQVYGP